MHEKITALVANENSSWRQEEWRFFHEYCLMSYGFEFLMYYLFKRKQII